MRITTGLSDPLLLPIEVVDLGEGAITVLVRGDVDLDEAGELRAVLNDAAAGDHQTVIVDLAGVHFLGSSGMGVLAAASARLRDEDRQLLVCGCRPAIRRAFEVAHLDRHLDLD